MPNLRQLRYFLAVADQGSFTAAAERLHIAQPALSRHIMNLEAELETRLFERHSRAVHITEAGQRLRDRAHRLVEDLEFACAEVRQMSQGARHYVRLLHSSSVPLLGPLGEKIKIWLRNNPQLRVEIGQATSENQITDIAEGRADLGFVRLPVLRRATGVLIEPILREELVAVFPENHRLASWPAIPLAELAQEAFVFQPHPDRGGLSRRVYELCHEAGFVPTVAQATSRKASSLHLVQLGLGIGLFPAAMAGQALPGVVVRPLATPAWTEIAVVRRIAPTTLPYLPDGAFWRDAPSL